MLTSAIDRLLPRRVGSSAHGARMAILTGFVFCRPNRMECRVASKIDGRTHTHTLTHTPLSVCLSLSSVFYYRETAQKYAVQSMPTFLMLKKGKKVDELKGAGEDALRQAISRNA